ncbi:diaminopimelate epimerase [Bacillus sp. CGMCC 1.16607]|uniref:diaminopimelate epimerase n=1 Tax=Bacillus sp. CGMCC 1.16607 TaxID=3351842 RepID=UPI003642540A
MQIEILKVHGSSNDFLLIDEMTNQYSFSEEVRRDLAIFLCDRENGIGADGILFTMSSKSADARMRVFNSDGSEASMCGNGLRCVARYVCEHLEVDKAIIETMKANLFVKKQEDIFPNVPTYQVEISPVSFQLEDLPLNISKETLINDKIEALSNELTFTAVAVPNPHLISIVDDLDEQYDFQKEMSEYVNGPNDLFPDGVNVSFVKSLEKGHIYVRTFERGVGFTNACGTAMSASSLVTCLLDFNHVEEKIHVYNDGGMVNCVVHKNGQSFQIDLIGNATYVFKANVQIDGMKTIHITDKNEFAGENENYKQLQQFARDFLNGFNKGQQ